MALQEHGDHQHSNDTAHQETAQQDTTHEDSAGHHQQSENPESSYNHPKKVTADFEDFPNLHPLVVHVPLIFLLLVIVFQVLAFIVYKEAMSWCALGSIVIGFVGAYAAAVWTHPPVAVSELPEHANQVYQTHDMWATRALWLSGIGAFLKIISHFILKRKAWAEIIVLLVFLGSGYSVTMAGHHGSQLVFIEGIGPQGKYMNGKHQHSH